MECYGEALRNSQSEQEDLLDQLARQDQVMRQLQDQLASFKTARDEYKELVVQQQKSGNFLGCKMPDEMTNILLTKEIQALQWQIEQLDVDLQVASHDDNEALGPKETNQELMWEQQEWNQDKMTCLKVDLKEAKKERDLLNRQAQEVKEEANKANKTMMAMLSRKQQEPKEYSVDLERLIGESTVLWANLEAEHVSSKKSKGVAEETKRKARGRSAVTYYPDVERLLKALKKDKRLASQCKLYLRRLTASLLETLITKQRLLVNRQSANLTLAKRLSKLCQKPEQDLLIPNEEKTAKDETKQEVEFQQQFGHEHKLAGKNETVV